MPPAVSEIKTVDVLAKNCAASIRQVLSNHPYRAGLVESGGRITYFVSATYGALARGWKARLSIKMVVARFRKDFLH